MGTRLTYGSVVLDAVNITEFASIPQYAEDHSTMVTVENTVYGTAVIHETANVYTQLAALRDLVTTPRPAPCTVVVDGVTLIDARQPDDKWGPFGEFRVVQIAGTRSVIVAFTIRYTAHEYPSGTSHLCSHRWVQSISVDGNGKITRTVNGSAIARTWPTPSVSSLVAAATSRADRPSTANLDMWRYALIPYIYVGYRRTQQQFAMSEDGTTLIYTVVDEQVFRAAPSAVKSGDCSFTFTRDFNGSIMGRKTFSATLHGDLNTKPTDLIQAAVDLSTERFTYLGKDADFFESLTVTEQNMLTENTITFEVVGYGVSVGDPGGTVPAMVGKYFTFPWNEYKSPSPYGDRNPVVAVHYREGNWVKPGTDQPGHIPSAALKCNDLLKSLPTPLSGTMDFCQAPDDELKSTASAFIGANTYASTINRSLTSDTTAPYVWSRGLTKVNVQPSIATVAAQDITQPDLRCQWGRPVVELMETAEYARQGSPPERLIRPMPYGATLVDETWDVTSGRPDANGNRLFVGRFVRKFRLGANAGNTNWTQRTNDDGMNYLEWWANNGQVLPGYDATIVAAAQAGTTSSVEGISQQFGFPIGNADYA